MQTKTWESTEEIDDSLAAALELLESETPRGILSLGWFFRSLRVSFIVFSSRNFDPWARFSLLTRLNVWLISELIIRFFTFRFAFTFAIWERISSFGSLPPLRFGMMRNVGCWLKQTNQMILAHQLKTLRKEVHGDWSTGTNKDVPDVPFTFSPFPLKKFNNFSDYILVNK